MTDYRRGGQTRHPTDKNWVPSWWLLPLAIALGVTILTAGFAALTFVVAVVVGLVATALHFASGR